MKINLLKKYEQQNIVGAIQRDFDEHKAKIKGFKNEHDGFKVGDTIEFMGGYNKDICYTTIILGFDKDGDIYPLWDCYWFPIRLSDENRKIKRIESKKQLS